MEGVLVPPLKCRIVRACQEYMVGLPVPGLGEMYTTRSLASRPTTDDDPAQYPILLIWFIVDEEVLHT